MEWAVVVGVAVQADLAMDQFQLALFRTVVQVDGTGSVELDAAAVTALPLAPFTGGGAGVGQQLWQA
ncbi:hypothetical protein D9M73_198670 [compost metagenome]